MAHELYYTAHFSNEQSQDVEIFFYKKDAVPAGTVENYEILACETTDNSKGQSKYDSTVIVRELFLLLFTTDADSITWETFVSSEHDTWKIEAKVDGQFYFEGFIVPDEGNAPFQDKPYEIPIRATNGLALLKSVELSDWAGDPFDGEHTLIEYIAGALKKTGLDLSIRIYCGYFHLSMLNKGNGLQYDMFNQAMLDYRTFQKDPTTFVSCYDALMIILDKFCRLEYWNGMWVIQNLAELQYLPVNNYYVDYTSTGSVSGYAQDSSNHAQVGKDVDIYPIHEDQSIYARYAVKSVLTRYSYTPWPEVPKNNRFERGTEFETGTALDEDDIDNDSDTSEVIGTYKKFTIPNWEFGKILSPIPANFPFPLTTPDGNAYVKSVYNSFGVEIQRKVVIETPASGFHWLRSEAIPVKRESKVRISLKKKFAADFTGGSDTATTAALAYIVDDSGTQFWGLSTASPGGSIPAGKWVHNSLSQLVIQYVEDQDSRKYAGLDITSMAIPSDGNLFIVFNCGTGPVGATQDYANFNFEYLPFVAGGYLQIKGDYFNRVQSANFPDRVDEEVLISDSPQKVFKGALLFNNQLTDQAWYRFGEIGDPNITGDHRHFKELLNLSRFNHSRRRMYALEGSFNGLNYAAQNDQLNKKPIAFFKRYRQVDMSAQREFVLVPPLKMDIIRGWVTANLVEVKKDNNDGTEEGTAEFKYTFK
jgi:hypothetical protein